MQTMKQIIFKSCFMIELITFAFMYLLGPYGMHTLQAVRDDIAEIQESQREISIGLEELAQQIDAWQLHDFYKEKTAREQLQMAREDETIYYLTYE